MELNAIHIHKKYWKNEIACLQKICESGRFWNKFLFLDHLLNHTNMME